MSYSVSDILEFVEENDVKFIRLAFCDIFGRLKNFSIMPYQLATAFEDGIAFDGSSILGFRDIVHSDLFLKPDPDTLSVLPWRPQQGRVVRFYCDIYTPEGARFEADPRAVLQRTTKKIKDMGYVCNVGAECEFYLFKQDDNGEDTLIPYDNGGYFDVFPADKGANVRRDICLTLEQMGIYPEVSHHEAGPGQNEIVFRFADALTTADNFLTFKNVVRTIANRNGAGASFRPKPLKENCGNGLHINMSLSYKGKNLFDSKDEELRLKAENFMAGVLNRAAECTLFFNTLEESYDRLGEYEAPSYVSWSEQNRSQLMRIPFAKGERKRFELRSPDPYVNPYVCIALIIEAGLEGIENGEKLPPAVDFDINRASSEQLKGIEKLPATFSEAVKKAESSDFIKRVLGEEIASKFIALSSARVKTDNFKY